MKEIKLNIIEEMIRRSFEHHGAIGPIDITYCKVKDYDDDLGASGEHIECKFALKSLLPGLDKKFHCFIRTDMYEFNVKKQKEIIFV